MVLHHGGGGTLGSTFGLGRSLPFGGRTQALHLHEFCIDRVCWFGFLILPRNIMDEVRPVTLSKPEW